MFENIDSEVEALNITLEACGFELGTSSRDDKYHWWYKPNGSLNPHIPYDLDLVRELVCTNLGITSVISPMRWISNLERLLNTNTQYGHILGYNNSIEFCRFKIS